MFAVAWGRKRWWKHFNRKRRIAASSRFFVFPLKSIQALTTYLLKQLTTLLSEGAKLSHLLSPAARHKRLSGKDCVKLDEMWSQQNIWLHWHNVKQVLSPFSLNISGSVDLPPQHPFVDIQRGIPKQQHRRKERKWEEKASERVYYGFCLMVRKGKAFWAMQCHGINPHPFFAKDGNPLFSSSLQL